MRVPRGVLRKKGKGGPVHRDAVAAFTWDGGSVSQFVSDVEAGMLGVNVPVPVGHDNFGGLRRSKFGEAHMFGPDAARFYTKLQTVSQRWPEPNAQTATSLAFAPNG